MLTICDKIDLECVNGMGFEIRAYETAFFLFYQLDHVSSWLGLGLGQYIYHPLQHS